MCFSVNLPPAECDSDLALHPHRCLPGGPADGAAGEPADLLSDLSRAAAAAPHGGRGTLGGADRLGVPAG